MSLNRKTPLRAKKPWPNKKKPSLTDLKDSGKVKIAAVLGPAKPRKKLKARSDKNLGWWDVALEIWNERDHCCEVCFQPIDEPQPENFSHLLPRGSYIRFKRDKRNIIIKCRDCHDRWHKFGPEALQHSFKWRAVTSNYFILRDEANGIR